MRYNEVSTNLKSRRLLPSRYACHLLAAARSRSGSDNRTGLSFTPLAPLRYLSEGDFFVSSIITQIGRENNISADSYLCIKDRRGRRSLQFINILMRRSVKRGDFLHNLQGFDLCKIEKNDFVKKSFKKSVVFRQKKVVI